MTDWPCRIALAGVVFAGSLVASATASQPSDHDILTALAKRVDRVQNNAAFTRRIAQGALTKAQEAANQAGCITGATPLDDGTLVAVIDPACIHP